MFWIGLALTLFLVATAIGGAAKWLGGVISRKNQREETTDQATYEKAKAEYDRDTNLGIMEKQLASSMEQDYIAAGDLEKQRGQEATASAQQTFLGQLQAEEELTSMKATNARSLGELQAVQGGSGAKADINLQTVINAELQAGENSKRAQIDKQQGLATYSRKNATDAMKTQQNRLESKYEEGGSVRDLYNYQRTRVTGDTLLTTTYLDDTIKKQEYFGNGWFLADLLGFTGEAADWTGNAAKAGM